MADLTAAVEVIRSSVSALDVANAIGLDVDSHGRCPCPFHHGKDRNMKCYDGDRGWSCFVCHQGGDAISLAQRYYQMQFKDTVRWFNRTFNLGMDIDSPMSQDAVKQAEMARQKRVREREHKEWLERMEFELAMVADGIVTALEDQRDANVPKTPDEPWTPAFCEAVETLPEAREFLEEMNIRMIRR